MILLPSLYSSILFILMASLFVRLLFDSSGCKLLLKQVGEKPLFLIDLCERPFSFILLRWCFFWFVRVYKLLGLSGILFLKFMMNATKFSMLYSYFQTARTHEFKYFNLNYHRTNKNITKTKQLISWCINDHLIMHVNIY